ncbi:MAG: CehA/McbA family metallohydrolase [Sandaracinaceae bacterium]|nr:CehA/McbA family metallohydrolase [Sandaracinaceae bacterium]
MRRFAFVLLLLAGCDPGDSPPDASREDAGGPCELPAFERGARDGHPDPLGVAAGEARAGRVRAEQLPAFPSRLEVWEGGDFVLANEHVAIVIEDAGASDLYDPWGGRPVGIARVERGALVEPGDFGEILILAGRMTVLTTHVTVLADGSDGGAAIVRAEGPMRPLPFFESVTAGLLPADFSAFTGAIDYVLEPGARHVDVFLELRSPTATERSTFTLHGFMHTPRMPPFASGIGFEAAGADVAWLGFADPAGTGFAYLSPGRPLGAGLEVSGFFSVITRGIVAQACAPNRTHHARLVLGGPDVDGLSRAVRETLGEASREVTGTVRDAAGEGVAGAWVLARDEGGFVSRTRSGADGAYRVAVPADARAELFAFREGDAPSAARAATFDGPLDLALAPGGWVRVRVRGEADEALPARVQLALPAGAAPRPSAAFGLPDPHGDRLTVAYPERGDVTLRAPAGAVRVIVSRGYEYELFDELVTVVDGATVEVPVVLERVIDTAAVQCGDFHIHTHRSNDSGDDALEKVRAAVGDGLELPVRSEHEYPGSFAREIAELGLEDWAFPLGSIELTSFQLWGHMGVVPLEADPSEVNAGAPRWQTYPTLEEPDAPIVARTPPEVFRAVRERSGAPVVIINHPRGSTNYFTYAGYDPMTGTVARPEAWEEEFGLVEVFNDRDWRSQLGGIVADWLGLLRAGRRVFAVGSSDSHALSRSPMGYPRTCLRLGTDAPRELTALGVRDALAGGRATISGGIYVDAWVGEAQPGDDARALGPSAGVRVRVQAASWVDVDALDVVVDGVIVDTIAIRPEDADPLVPTVRFDRTLDVDVAAAGGFVLFAAYGERPLVPVHPGRIPFGVTNPIFLHR